MTAGSPARIFRIPAATRIAPTRISDPRARAVPASAITPPNAACILIPGAARTSRLIYRQLQPAGVHPESDGGGARVDLEVSKETLEVRADCPPRDSELDGDLLVLEPERDELHDLRLSRREETVRRRPTLHTAHAGRGYAPSVAATSRKLTIGTEPLPIPSRLAKSGQLSSWNRANVHGGNGGDVTVQQSDELEALLPGLPPDIGQRVRALEGLEGLLEIVMDLGRLPEARFAGREEALARREVSAEDLAYVISHIGQFGGDNRAGIERTLHRISALRNRAGKVVGLTLRVGRAVYGTMEIIRDVVEAGRSILLLGRPGVGKTTLLREVARVLADEMGKRVVIVDTSNEIAGDGDIPHPGIGRARRMQVATPSLQHAVMIEAVENHMPEVVVIDEIGTEQEAAAARTIAERGVQLIATAHGNTLENLMLNPTLSDLVGGIQTVTLSD